jgi:ABC-type Fe3+-siderophore transport system permease subunit
LILVSYQSIQIYYSLGIFLDYTFNFASQIWRQEFSMLYMYLQSFCIFFIIYFMMKKASKQMSNSRYWMNLSKTVFLVGLAVSLVFMSWIQYQIIVGYYLKKSLDIQK